MPDEAPDPLAEEIRQLAQELAACDDGAVIEFAAWFAAEYRTLLDGEVIMKGIQAWEMTQEEMDRRSDRRVQQAREQLRNSLRNLLEWARKTRRI